MTGEHGPEARIGTVKMESKHDEKIIPGLTDKGTSSALQEAGVLVPSGSDATPREDMLWGPWELSPAVPGCWS